MKNSTAAGAITTGLDIADKPTAVELARRSIETFVSKDIKGWVALADENILTEFPFAPEGGPRRIIRT
jgi:hypothetical protein